jgi:tetratricopeptide (TPR) repeat protein
VLKPRRVGSPALTPGWIPTVVAKSKKTAKKTASSKPKAGRAQGLAEGPPIAMQAQALKRRPDPQTEAYEKGMSAFHTRDFAKAQKWFKTAIEGEDAALRHNAEVYVRICEQKLAPDATQPRTAEELYNLAVGLINDRQLDQAESHLETAIKKQPGAGHILYALAATAALRGDADKAFEALSKAIRADPANRFLARRDGDLAGVRPDPRISDLLQGDAD